MTVLHTTSFPGKMRPCNIAAAVLVVFFLEVAVQRLWSAQRQPLSFDDAYMFARYATNLRQGLGMSWNLDGVHTFGETSLLWGGIVWVFSFLPTGTWNMLTLASWLCGLGAIVAMAWAVAKNAVSPLLRSMWRVLPLVALPLAAGKIFLANAVNGMETMLATLLTAIFVGMMLLWRACGVSSVAVAVAGLLLVLARPEAAIAVVMMPGVMVATMRGDGLTVARLSVLLGVFCVGVAATLGICAWYFHSAVPLAFYIKGGRGYEGYAEVWHPGLLMMAFLGGCQLFLATMILTARRQDWRLLVCCVIPAASVFAYLFGVTQIMGFQARYYVPYFAFFVVPALLLVDRRIAEGSIAWMPGKAVRRGGIIGAMMLIFLALSSERVQAGMRHTFAERHAEYDPVEFDTAAQTELPNQDWTMAMAAVTDGLVAHLPAGATVAATEVGYLGSRSSQVNVIDMAGLNDTEIARHGFQSADLLARKPDLIWLPNSSYTYMRGVLLTEPAMLHDYDVYAGAAKFGVAVRKDSRFHEAMQQRFEEFWNATYPGQRLEDFRVRSVRWTGQKHVVVGN